MTTYHRIKKIELEHKAVAITFDNDDGVIANLSTETMKRVHALILEDLGIEWEHGVYGPEAQSME